MHSVNANAAGTGISADAAGLMLRRGAQCSRASVRLELLPAMMARTEGPSTHVPAQLPVQSRLLALLPDLQSSTVGGMRAWEREPELQPGCRDMQLLPASLAVSGTPNSMCSSVACSPASTTTKAAAAVSAGLLGGCRRLIDLASALVG